MAYPVDRRTYPHLRCGLCDETILPGQQTTYVDDERCHRVCIQAEIAGDVVFLGEALPVTDKATGA